MSAAAPDGSFSGCTVGTPASGNVVEMSAIGGTSVNAAAGLNLPAAGAGNRWLFLSSPGGLNEIGLAICFPVGSVAPTCAAGSCV
jgi:hypothetical protein